MSYCSSVLCYSSISSSDIRSVAAAVEATIVLSLLKKLFDANFSVIFLAYCTNDYCCLAYGVFSERFFVNSLYSLWLSKNLVKIKFSEINFIESISDYIKVHLVDKNVVTRETISNIEAKLPQNKFIRTHRSYIVSLDKIESFTNEYVEIGNKKEIPISRSYKNEVLQKLENNQ